MLLDVSPSSNPPDLGPASLLNGQRFGNVDLTVDGRGDCRIYFDATSLPAFHFADRHGETVVLGICEGGVEQVLATGKTAATGKLHVARHGDSLAIFENRTLICSAFDDRLHGGVAGLRMLDETTNLRLTTTPYDDIRFYEDFTLSEAHPAQWRGNGSAVRGDFGVLSLKHPLLSANGFCYLGAGRGIYSVVRQPNWDQYTFEAALRGPAQGRIGLVFAFHDEKNYGLFTWSARTPTECGQRQLIRVHNGVEEVLATAVGGYTADEWYAGKVTVAYGQAVVSIDGHELLKTSHPDLACGGAGVWCDVPLPAQPALAPAQQAYQWNTLNEVMKQHAVFDDVKIQTLESFSDDFRVAGELSGGWLVGQGHWRIDTSGELAVTPPEAGFARALIGDRRWSNYQIEADVNACENRAGMAGIVFLHRDESNFYSATIHGNELRLTKMADGTEMLVDRVSLPRTAPAANLKVTINAGHITVTSGTVRVEGFDTAPLRGRVGLIAGAGNARFRNFRVAWTHEHEPTATNTVFTVERSMNDWANPGSGWRAAGEPQFINGRAVHLLKHRSEFPGDVELSFEPAEEPRDAFEIALSVANDRPQAADGYVFSYRVDGAGQGVVQILKQGHVVAEADLPPGSPRAAQWSLRRCGKFVVAKINGRVALAFRDERPLPGRYLACYSPDLALQSEFLQTQCKNVREEFFTAAPVTWRAAGDAVADVCCRWQSDPRWSFFSLASELGKTSAAALWEKTQFPGDVTLEFYVATKMEGQRGPPFTYARDINVTLCSNGSDLKRGYTFMFGGNNNTGSMILRDGIEVKRSSTPVVIPTDMNFHFYWFRIEVKKQGSRVSFKADRYFSQEKDDQGELTGELRYDDPLPLTGNRLALWTFNNAIMISHVRIAAELSDTTENPSAEFPPLKSPYNPAR